MVGTQPQSDLEGLMLELQLAEASLAEGRQRHRDDQVRRSIEKIAAIKQAIADVALATSSPPLIPAH